MHKDANGAGTGSLLRDMNNAAESNQGSGSLIWSLQSAKSACLTRYIDSRPDHSTLASYVAPRLSPSASAPAAGVLPETPQRTLPRPAETCHHPRFEGAALPQLSQTLRIATPLDRKQPEERRQEASANNKAVLAHNPSGRPTGEKWRPTDSPTPESHTATRYWLRPATRKRPQPMAETTNQCKSARFALLPRMTRLARLPRPANC